MSVHNDVYPCGLHSRHGEECYQLQVQNGCRKINSLKKTNQEQTNFGKVGDHQNNTKRDEWEGRTGDHELRLNKICILEFSEN